MVVKYSNGSLMNKEVSVSLIMSLIVRSISSIIQSGPEVEYFRTAIFEQKIEIVNNLMMLLIIYILKIA